MSADTKLQKLREKLAEINLDAMLVSTPENRRYLSGFTGSAGYLLVTHDHAVLATDFRYVEQAGNQSPEFRTERISGGPAWFPKLVDSLGARRVGFESQNMTVATHAAFSKAVEEAEITGRPDMVSTDAIVDRLRAFKDEDELKLLEKAVEIADQSFEHVAPGIVPGVTEQAVSWELEKAMRERGADNISFDTIVGAGPNGALPHHLADDTVIQDGDAVVVDMGALYQGYCSDLSRTIIAGELDETFRKVYDTVLRAQITAEEQVTDGMTGAEVDAIARDVIAEEGYGENFGHSLGHGVGLAVHEFPRVGPNSDDVLENGMVFTIEPGIYLSGWGGVRIEDIVVLEGGKARIISRAHKRERVG